MSLEVTALHIMYTQNMQYIVSKLFTWQPVAGDQV